jgi:DNA primase
MDNIIEEIKEKVRIEDLVEETGITLERRHGRYLRPSGARGQGLHGLVLDTFNNSYHHNGQDDHGDVFNWVMNHMHKGWDFKAALEFLAKRAGVTIPAYGEKDMQARLTARVQEDVFQVAARVFHRWLLKSEAALAYAKGRGWTDETIEKAMMGFNGSASAAEINEMAGEFAAHGVDPRSAAAIAITGYRPENGVEGVTAWCKEHGIEPSGDWLNWGMIPGMMSKKTPRLVYASQYAGRVVYLFGRNLLLNDDGTLTGSDDPKSYNLNGTLIGGRKLYFNWVYGRKVDKVVLVEGPADADTLGQWGIAAIANGGTAWQDHEGFLRELPRNHEVVYIATDADKAGQKVIKGKYGNFPLADVLGPLLRVVRWPAKDANDWLKEFAKRGMAADRQAARVEYRLGGAATIAEVAARDAAKRKGKDDRLKATNRAFEIIAMIDRRTCAQMLTEFVRATGMGVRDFNRMLKEARGDKGKDDDDEKNLPRIETFGGWYPTSDDGEKGYLLEMLYNQKTRKASFAYRDPDGNVGTAPYMDINGYRYEPQLDEIVCDAQPTVILPGDLGELKSTRELVFTIEIFLRRYFLLDNPIEYKIAAFYALFTWVYDCFDALAYMRLRGPSGTGKSELALRIGLVSYRLIISSGIGTVASVKSFCHVYKGSLWIDECDKFASDENDDRLVMLNVGAMKRQGKVANMVEVFNPITNTRSFQPKSMSVYGPKILTMYKSFKDEATENRCITIDLRKKTMKEIEDAGIQADEIPPEMFLEAEKIRNMCIRWRLWRWEKHITAKPENKEKLKDYRVSPRINQVMKPIKIIAQDDEEMLRDIDLFMQASYAEQMEKKAQSLVARVADAIVAAVENKKYSAMVVTGSVGEFGTVKYIYYKHLAQIANSIMDEMNLIEDAPDEETKKKRGIQPNTIGTISRDDLQFPTRRKGAGFVVVLLPERIEIMKVAWGLDSHTSDQEPTPPEKPEQKGMFDEPNEG